MPALADYPVFQMAKRKNLDGRLQIRVDPKWLEEVDKVAQTLSLSVAAFFRLAVNEEMRRRKEDDTKKPKSK